MWWKRKQQDFHAEIEAHLQLETDQLRAEGMTLAEAQAAARRTFGNRTSAEERFYESGRWVYWDHLIRDVRFAARVLMKDCPSRIFGGARVLCFVKRIYRGRSAAGIGQPVGFGGVKDGRAHR